MSRHTPGPWITDTEAIFSESGRKIAKIVGANSTETDEEFVEIEDNASLIAAAPQMLEALEAIIKRFQPEQHDAAGCMFKNCELCKAIAVIKAAKGKV